MSQQKDHRARNLPEWNHHFQKFWLEMGHGHKKKRSPSPKKKEKHPKIELEPHYKSPTARKDETGKPADNPVVVEPSAGTMGRYSKDAGCIITPVAELEAEKKRQKEEKERAKVAKRIEIKKHQLFPKDRSPDNHPLVPKK